MQTQLFEIIFIMLGDACNFKCKYCLQGEHNNPVIAPNLSDKFLAFLDEYPSDSTRLSFWGGEPLLYFDSIKQIVDRYKEKFTYEMVSNGSLLTEDIVNFLNENKIAYHLSHDGKYTEETRLVDVLKNERIKSLFERIDTKSVNVTITSKSPSMKEIFAYYPSNYGININTMINTTNTDISRNYADFDYEKYKRDYEYLFKSFEDYLDGDKSKSREAGNVTRLMGSFQAFLKEGRQRNRCFACGHGKKMLNIDCNGNFYICHNSKVSIGSTENTMQDIAKNLDNILVKTRSKCESCEVNNICSGSCFMLDGYGEKQNCEMLKNFYNLFISWLLKAKEKYEAVMS